MDCSRLGVQADCNSSVTAMPLFVPQADKPVTSQGRLRESLIQWPKVSGPGCLELPAWICMSWPEVQDKVGKADPRKMENWNKTAVCKSSEGT